MGEGFPTEFQELVEERTRSMELDRSCGELEAQGDDPTEYNMPTHANANTIKWHPIGICIYIYISGNDRNDKSSLG